MKVSIRKFARFLAQNSSENLSRRKILLPEGLSQLGKQAKGTRRPRVYDIGCLKKSFSILDIVLAKNSLEKLSRSKILLPEGLC